MRKFILVLIALLLAAAYTVAVDGGADDIAITALNQSDSIEVPETDTAVGTDLVAAEKPKPTLVRRPITRLHLTGNGIAISELDAFDFMHAKVVIGAVKVMATSADAVDTDFAVRRLGVLMLDEKKYHLKDIAVSIDEISAEIYGPTTTATASSEAIGEIKVKRFEKPGRDIWAGNLVLNEKAYNVYFLGVKRNFRLTEITQKLGEYCEENTEDTKCKKIVPTCTQNSEDCGERIEEHCKNNTTDQKCLQLKKLYCLKNASDERCREYLKGLCEKYPKLAHCRIRTVAGQNVVGIKPTAVSAATVETGEVTDTLVVRKVRPKLTVVKKPIESVSPGAAEQSVTGAIGE